MRIVVLSFSNVLLWVVENVSKGYFERESIDAFSMTKKTHTLKTHLLVQTEPLSWDFWESFGNNVEPVLITNHNSVTLVTRYMNSVICCSKYHQKLEHSLSMVNYVPLQNFPFPVVFPWQMHLPSLHFARESQSMSFLHPCKGAVKALIILRTIWHWHYTVVSYWGIPWYYMILNNTCNPLRPFLNFILHFFIWHSGYSDHALQ